MELLEVYDSFFALLHVEGWCAIVLSDMKPLTLVGCCAVIEYSQIFEIHTVRDEADKGS